MFGKRGHYPEFQIETPQHLLVTSEERCWSAVVQPNLPEGWEWSERVTLTPEEIRLFAAITLCEPDPWENGLLIVTHWTDGGFDPGNLGWDLCDMALRERVEETVSDLVQEAAEIPRWLPSVPGPYVLGEGTGSLQQAATLLHAIDVEDQLLLAGLGRLLQAFRLGQSNDGPGDSALPMFIAMGAAFEVIRLRLSTERGADQPMREAFEYLRATFPRGDDVVEYFEDMYDYRILTMHPASRLGEYWTTPMMVGEVYDLRRSLISLYRHILTGEIEP